MNDKSVLWNFVQGTFWQSRLKKCYGKTVLPLLMYFDDFESGNVLVSHLGVHKVGAVYVSISCIPPHRMSVISNIMGFILSYYVKDLQLFSLQVLNDRLFAFDFGPEKKNRVL